MIWSQPLTWLEVFFGLAFVLLGGFYIFRTKRLARYFSQQANQVWFKAGIRLLYFSLLIIALLGPSFGAMRKEIRTTGKDIFIAIDLSNSMNATDVQPSRLQKIKFELGNIINQFNSDRIGLIIFSSEAFLQCPLTFDYGALHMYTQTLETSLVPGGSTDLAPALRLAIKKFGDKNTSDSEKRSKILVLITDGEDFGDETESALRELRKENIRLFTLGIGTIEGGRIPLRNGFKKDKEGTTVITKLNQEKLQELASEADGQYFEITSEASEVSRLIRSINNIKGELQETKLVDVTANKYYYPLALALLLIVFDLMVTVYVIRL